MKLVQLNLTVLSKVIDVQKQNKIPKHKNSLVGQILTSTFFIYFSLKNDRIVL